MKQEKKKLPGEEEKQPAKAPETSAVKERPERREQTFAPPVQPASAAAPLPAPAGFGPAMQALHTAETQPPVYSSTYDDRIARLYEKISQHRPFSYSASQDPLYQQRAEQYERGGELAMRDSMGQAAQLTGGYDSSYSQALGQQQYDEYMSALADALPEFYDRARKSYDEQLGRELSAQQAQAKMDYDRYRDSISDLHSNRDFGLKQQKENYQKLLYLMQNSRYFPTSEEMAASGLTEAQARSLYMELHPGGTYPWETAPQPSSAPTVLTGTETPGYRNDEAADKVRDSSGDGDKDYYKVLLKTVEETNRRHLPRESVVTSINIAAGKGYISGTQASGLRYRLMRGR